MKEQPITLTFEFTQAEYRRAIWHVAWNGKGGRGIIGWPLVIVLAVVLYTFIQNGRQPTPPSAAPLNHAAPGTSPSGYDLLNQFVIPFLPWLIVFFFVWFILLRMLRGKGTARQQRTYIFRSDGVSVAMPYQRSEMEWLLFQRFFESKRFFILMTAPRVGHVIPKRAFASGMEMDRFRQLLNDHINVPTARQAFPVTHTSPPQLPPGSG